MSFFKRFYHPFQRRKKRSIMQLKVNEGEQPSDDVQSDNIQSLDNIRPSQINDSNFNIKGKKKADSTKNSADEGDDNTLDLASPIWKPNEDEEYDDNNSDLADATPYDPNLDYEKLVWESICKEYEGTEKLKRWKEMEEQVDKYLKQMRN